MNKLIGMLVLVVGCAAEAGESVGEVTQGLHYGTWRMFPDEDATPNTFNSFPSVASGQRWTLVDDWRTNLSLPAEYTFDDGFLWFAGTSCGFNCSGEVFEPAVGINSNPALYDSIVAIDHVHIYWAFSNSTGHNVTVWMNILDANGHVYTKDRFADPHVDGIYFGVGVEPGTYSPGSVGIGAVRLEVVYATP